MNIEAHIIILINTILIQIYKMEIDQITLLVNAVFTGVAAIIYAWKGTKPE